MLTGRKELIMATSTVVGKHVVTSLDVIPRCNGLRLISLRRWDEACQRLGSFVTVTGISYCVRSTYICAPYTVQRL